MTKTNNAEEGSYTIEGKWLLSKFHKKNIEIDKSNQSFIPTLVVKVDEKKIGGRDGCNLIFASLSKLNKQEITIGAVGGTKVGCKMEKPYDEEYRNLLRTARTYKIISPFLTLFGEQDIKLLEFERIKE